VAADLHAAGDGRQEAGSSRGGLGLIRCAAFWPLFTALVAVFAYGFWSGGLIHQSMWTRLGLTRLEWFLGAYGIWAIAGMALFPRWFTRATIALSAAYGIAAVGPQAPAAVLFLLSSSWVLGLLLRADGLLALALGVSVYTFVIGFLVHLPVNYPFVYAAIFALPWMAGWRRVRAAAQPLFAAPLPASRPSWMAAALLSMVLVMHLLVALGPEAGADGLAVHLTVPASIALHHRWVFDVRDITWSAMPLNADWGFTAAFLLGGEAAARLFNFAMLLVTTGFLYGLLRRILPPASSMLLSALFVSSPIVQLVSGSLFVENFWAAMIAGAFAALVRYRETGEARYGLSGAALCGASLATKFGSFAFLVPFAILLALELRRRRAARLVPAIAAIVLLFGSPPYLRAWWNTGNPVFPFMNQIFRSPDFPAESFTDGRYAKPLSANTLFDVTFRTSRHFEGQNGGWAFQFLVLLPLSIALMPRNAGYAAWSALVLSLAFGAGIMALQSNVRYLYPALPLFTVAIGGMAAGLRNASRRGYMAIASSAVVFTGLNLYLLPASGWCHQDFFVNSLFDPLDRERYIKEVSPRRALVDYLNRAHRGEPALFVESSQIAGFAGKPYTTNWHTFAFSQGLWSKRTALDCAQYLNQFKIRFLIAPANPGEISFGPLRQMIAAFTTAEYEFGGWRVSRIRDEFAGGKLSPRLQSMTEGRWLAGPGEYDDTNPHIGFIGSWITDRQFAQAVSGTVTYSNHPGDVARLTFTGSRVIWVYTKAFNRGRAEIWIDGRKSIIDLYAPQVQWRQRTEFGPLTPGRHVLEVRVTGDKDPLAQSCWVDVDQFIVE
jgi:hypothetical protein